MPEFVKLFFEKHLFKCLGGALGLTIAILFLTIGFFKTMLILLLLIIGVFLGARVDRAESVRTMLGRLIPGKRDDDPFH